MIHDLKELIYPFLFDCTCNRCGLFTIDSLNICDECSPFIFKVEVVKNDWNGVHISLFDYNQESRRWVHQLKYFGASKIAQKVLRKIEFSTIEIPIENRIWVPVPQHWRRKRERGYNQAKIVANSISKIDGVVSELLIKNSHSKSLTKKK